MIAELRNRPNLFVARTFSKAYGMAGLRLGVLAGGAQLMRTVRRVGSPYNVNAAALACLPVALADAAYVSEYAAQARGGRERLERELSRMGVKFWPSRANFVLASIGERRKELVESMRQRGILLRDRSSDPGCYGCVRITVGPPAQMDRLLEALREVLPQIGILHPDGPTSGSSGTLVPGEVTA
jgi:histidinol-phosphate aminotransferase